MPRKGDKIYRRASDGRYVAPYRDDLNRPRYAYGKTYEDAEQKRDDARERIRSGLSASAPAQTVEAYLKDWITHTAPHGREPSTVATHERHIRRHIVPLLGKVRLSQLQPSHVRQLHQACIKKGLSKRTIENVHASLSAALQSAVTDRIVRENVARLAPLPKMDPPPPIAKTLTEEEGRRLLKAAEGQPYGALIITILLCALRRGEAIRLVWRDVDLDGGILRVRKGKTTSSVRETPLIPPVVRLLAAHRAAEQLKFRMLRKKWSEDSPVFTSLTRAERISILLPKRALDKLLADAGMERLRVHDLRHSCASLLFALGVDVVVISRILGHASVRVTEQIYIHLMPDKKREALGRLEGLFGGEKDGTFDG